MTVKWRPFKAKVVRNTEVAPGRYLLSARAQEMAHAVPGQFVHVLAGPTLDPCLRRPLSVAMVDGDIFTLLFGTKGAGTHLLAQVKHGKALGVMGPLGKGFPLVEEDALLVAGGVGIAPLLFLADRLGHAGVRVRVVVGARTASELAGLELLEGCAQVMTATDDGSCGLRGTAVDLAVPEMKQKPPQAVYACGPEPMMRGVSQAARALGLPCWVSLEARMGCGVGACLGCVVDSRDGYLRVCADGPVFNAEGVFCVG
ncbi:MAG: dihydroorotate dehydrogenase electron transfer subunit [Bacillota bacterium]